MSDARDRLGDRLLAWPARAAGGLIWLYQKTVSPALAVVVPTGGCRFAPTCSHYARAALQEHGLVTGVWLTLRRLVKCGPWHPGGEDPVPARKFSCVRTQPVGAQACCALDRDATHAGRSKSAPLLSV